MEPVMKPAMTRRILTRGVVTVAMLTAVGGAAIGCSPREEPATETSTPASSAPVLTPTDKAVGPGATNSFSPTVNPVPPGASCQRIENGVCVR